LLARLTVMKPTLGAPPTEFFGQIKPLLIELFQTAAQAIPDNPLLQRVRDGIDLATAAAVDARLAEALLRIRYVPFPTH